MIHTTISEEGNQKRRISSLFTVSRQLFIRRMVLYLNMEYYPKWIVKSSLRTVELPRLDWTIPTSLIKLQNKTEQNGTEPKKYGYLLIIFIMVTLKKSEA